MTQTYLIGIDGGSQSSKVTIFTAEGHVVCEASQPLAPMHTPRSGVAEHPDDDLYDSVVVAARRAVAQFPGDLADVVGIGLCTIRCCRALVRGDGTLAAPVQSWMDDRLSRAYDPDGNPEVAYVTTSSGYLMGRLTGERSDTVANYIGPWPVDVRAWDWCSDPETFDAFQVPREMLYELQMPGQVGGHLTPAAADLMGLPAGLPVVHTANDKATEALGAGLASRGGLVSLGTYIAGMVLGEEYVPSSEHFFINFAAEPGRYLYESGGIRRGMWTVTWLKDLVGAEARLAAEAAGLSVEDHLNALAAAVPAGSDGLLCVLDWLAPPTEPHKRGMFLGFDERHGYAHMYRAILEGIALRMRLTMTAMERELDSPIEWLTVSGGGSHSDVAMQILADVFDMPVRRNTVRNAAGLGAAMCAAVACAVHPSVEEATHRMVHPADVFTPDAARARLYRDLRNIYADIPSQTDPVLTRLHSLLQ